MISSRDSILRGLRAQPLPVPPLPEVVHGAWTRYDDPIAQLISVIQGVGGSCERCLNVAAVAERLSSFPEYRASTAIVSTVAGIDGHRLLDAIDDPHQLEDIDFLVTSGAMAVAENGAVWVTDKRLKHRVAYFINQHLVMIVRKSDVVHNMHEAYARLKLGAPQFGCFISGPSKTADIEQSLVIGAHGCRTMQLYVVDH